MKTLGICLAFLLGPPGTEVQVTSQASDPSPRVSTMMATQDASPDASHLQLVRPEAIPTVAVPTVAVPTEAVPTVGGAAANSRGMDTGDLTLRLGLTGLLVLLSVYFYRISVELGREALRRDRLARRFVEGNHTLGPLRPIQGCNVDQVDSLLLDDHVLEAG